MKKKVGIIKRALCLSLVFLLNINALAAVVSDNDGSAFITKAEFDSLKNNFQSQIDSYNQSIDNKIDGAIASYLSGIKLQKEEERRILLDSSKSVMMVDNNNFKAQFPIDVQSPTINGHWNMSRFRYDPNYWKGTIIMLGTGKAQPNEKRIFIDGEDGVKDTIRNRNIFEWKGYSDSVSYTFNMIGSEPLNTSYFGAYWGLADTDPFQLRFSKTSMLSADGDDWCNQPTTTDFSYHFLTLYLNLGTSGAHAEGAFSARFNMACSVNNISRSLGTLKNQYILVPGSAPYTRWTHYTKYLWLRNDTETTTTGYPNFNDYDASATETSHTDKYTYKISDFFDNLEIHFRLVKGDNTTASYDRIIGIDSTGIDYEWPATTTFLPTSNYRILYPYVGFCHWLDNWNQLYLSDFTSLVQEYVQSYGANNNLFKIGSNDYRYPVFAGYPLVECDNNTKSKYLIKFEDSSKTYDLYLNNKPFGENYDTDFTFTGGAAVTGKKCRAITGPTTIEWENSEKQMIFLKWSEHGTTNGGGTLIPSPTVSMIKID